MHQIQIDKPHERPESIQVPVPSGSSSLFSRMTLPLPLPGNAFYLNLRQIDIKCYFFRFIQGPTTAAEAGAGPPGHQ